MPVDLTARAVIEASRTTRVERFVVFDATVSWLLGVSLVAVTPHLGNPYFFLGSVYSYRLVGPGIAEIVAMVFPFLEVVLAACLITNLFRGAAHSITLGNARDIRERSDVGKGARFRYSLRLFWPSARDRDRVVYVVGCLRTVTARAGGGWSATGGRRRRQSKPSLQG